MKIDVTGDKYVALTQYEERHIMKEHGWRWDPSIKRWWTTDVGAVIPLVENYGAEVSEEVAKRIDAATREAQQAREESRAVDADIDVPVPEGLSLYGYQRAGVAYALKRRHTLIADEMGLGKTVQAIGVMNVMGARRTLIVCPAFLKENWRREVLRWSVPRRSVAVLSGRQDTGAPEADVVIINYEVIADWESLRDEEWDLIVYDEAHYLKNPKAKRTETALEIRGGRVLYLTGTPVLNRPIELYPILRHAGLRIASNWYHYVTRYCGARQTRYGWDVRGASNTMELAGILREQIMVRRLKKDVLTELPDKIRQVVVLSDETGVAREAVAAYRRMLRAKRALAKAETEEARAKAREEYNAAFGELSRLRREVGEAKIPAISDWAVNTLENEGCVVVFAHHREVAEQVSKNLREAGYSVGLIHGGIGQEGRQAIVDAFQAGKLDAVVGTIGAMGVGLTITRASVAIMGELDWTPARLVQAEDRLHRIGQENKVQIIYLVHESSIDEKIVRTLDWKQNVIDRVMDDEEVIPEELLDKPEGIETIM